jgi:ABC-2 type transport system permease protein
LNQLNIIWPTIRKEWKAQTMDTGRIYKFLGDAARSAALAWIVYQSGALDTLAFVAVGVALISIWTGVLTLGGWSLETELYGKTLDFTLISRSPMSVILFGKTLAQALYEIPTGIVSFAVALLVVRQIPHVADPASLSLSLVLAMVGMVVTGFFFAALVVLVGGRAGFFMGIMPFVAVLSGFILPVGELPLGLEVLARLMPSSWAMDGVWASIGGIAAWGEVVRSWAVCILMSGAWFAATYYICAAVEKRIRVTGTLGAY